MASAGTIKGTALVPGISRNGRLYTKTAIAKAVARAQARIEDGSNPITMLTHHGAEDDSTRIVGRLTSITLADDGSAKFEAKLADTDHARDIATLTDPEDPYLTGVSIRGWWAEDPTVEVAPDGTPCETADDLELDGLDLTKSPGVIGARIGESAPVAIGARGIAESIDEVLVEASKTPYGAGISYADPGYQSDKVKRYPLDTKAHAKAAWSYINQKDNAALYTANQLKRIRGRIKAALKKFGVDVSGESSTTGTAPVLEFTETPTVGEVTECWGDYGNQVGTAGFSLSLYNGPLTISVSAYSGIEAEKLAVIGAAAMAAAVNAVGVLDPDTDGDVDGPMDDEDLEPSRKPDDNNMETGPSGAATEIKETAPVTAPVTETEAPAVVPAVVEPAAVEPTEGAAEVEDEKDEAAETAAVESAEDRIVARILEAIKPAVAPVVEAAPVAAAVEAAPAAEVVTETVEQITARVRAEEAVKARDRLLEQIHAGNIRLSRKGLVATPAEESAPPKPLHEMSPEEFRAYRQSAGLVEWAIPNAAI